AASVAFETGQPARAAQLYTRALEDQPENPLARVGAARAALAQGDVRRAQEHTAGALRQAPNDPDVLIGLGDIFAD
ncbi:MAG: tetratricopeptide repeat protein, partial [Anaerolineae bacterium]|nr:tetratricopeptide repeat protein [Anaerolineae bacterium]